MVAWDDAVADRIAAENLYLDESKERRRAEIEALHAPVGACRAGEGFATVENALRGDWTMACDRGRASGGDHARADEPAEGAVHVDPARTRGYAENGDVPALTVGHVDS